jgi:DNA-binding transcriptional ArsR family regulator
MATGVPKYKMLGVMMVLSGSFTISACRGARSAVTEQHRMDNWCTMTGPVASFPDLARVAKALADDRRAELCLTLIDGRAWTPVELARFHGWPRSSVTEHLNLLISAGLVAEVRQGKHRYARLASTEAAEVIEQLAALARASKPAANSFLGQRLDARLREGRTCYHHLAGELGIRLRDGLLRAGLIGTSDGYTLTRRGYEWFEELGHPIRRRDSNDRRAVIRPCLDWTERVDHLAGIAGDTLCFALTELQWIDRRTTDRAVTLNLNGKASLLEAGIL